MSGNNEKNFGRGKTQLLVFCAVMAALLVAVQLALSFAAGVELVTLLLCAFCVAFGPWWGALTAFCFCLLRCLFWGFSPVNVQAVYFIYFPCFALAVGFYGKLLERTFEADTSLVSALKRRLNGKSLVVFAGLVGLVCLMTVSFTLLDDLISPIIGGMSKGAAKAYFYASLPTMGVHTAVATLSVAVLFIPVYAVFLRAKRGIEV